MNALDELNLLLLSLRPDEVFMELDLPYDVRVGMSYLVIEEGWDAAKVAERVLRDDYWTELNRVDYRRGRGEWVLQQLYDVLFVEIPEEMVEMSLAEDCDVGVCHAEVAAALRDRQAVLTEADPMRHLSTRIVLARTAVAWDAVRKATGMASVAWRADTPLWLRVEWAMFVACRDAIPHIYTPTFFNDYVECGFSRHIKNGMRSRECSPAAALRWR